MSYSNSKEADILFQKLGNTWYIFAEVDNEMVYSALPEGVDPHTTRLELYDVIEDHISKVARSKRKKTQEV